MKLITKRFNVKSKTSKMTYVVSVFNDGSWVCSCPIWIFHKGKNGERVDCVHIKEVRDTELMKTRCRELMAQTGSLVCYVENKKECCINNRNNK